MNATVRRGLILLVFAMFALTAYLGARYWQSAQQSWTRVTPRQACNLRHGPCSQPLGGGELVFSISPRDIPLMKPLSLEVETRRLTAVGVAVEICGLNMDMGLNRTRLEPSGEGGWRGETILPVCSQRSMQWEAVVQIETEGRLEVPFRFATLRP